MMGIAKIHESQMDLTETHAMIHDLRNMVLSLVVFKHIPDERLLRLRYRWIRAFLNGRNRKFMISPDRLSMEAGEDGLLVTHQPPSGVPAVPGFTVMHDLQPEGEDPAADDPELFIASRIATLTSIAQICGQGVVETLKLIEGSASPLEQLARQAE